MNRFLYCIISWYMFCGLNTIGVEQSQDVTVFTEFYNCDEPASIPFCYKGQYVGEGREAFQHILEKVKKLPAGTSIVWGPDAERCGHCCPGQIENMAKYLYPEQWKELLTIVEQNKLKLSSTYGRCGCRKPEPKPVTGQQQEPTLAPPLVNEPKKFRFQWHNYRGPTTPHAEVFYELNGRVIGCGDLAFQIILKELATLKPGDIVSRPIFQYSGRWSSDAFDEAELNANNEKLKMIVPFATQFDEYQRILKDNQLVEKDNFSGGIRPDRVDNVMDWGEDDHNFTFGHEGNIIHHTAQPRPAALRLGWTNYPHLGLSDRKTNKPRPSEQSAFYTINGKSTGQGIHGFAGAIKQIEQLPAGSVIQVEACIRTRAPFVCPIIIENKRHYERSGYEPYIGMLPWLIQVAHDKKLEIDWIPDEGGSIFNCEINR
jgi:hypothetical protein